MTEQGETPIEQRLDRVETTQASQGEKLDELIGLVRKFTGGAPVTHEAAQQQTEEHLDRPSSVAEQVRAELARADKEKAEATEKETIGQRLAKLEERKPEPPQPRRERAMWGPR